MQSRKPEIAMRWKYRP